MAHQYYLVYIDRKEGVSFDDVKKKMDLARSWYRINESLWVLHSTSDFDKLNGRYLPLVKESGRLFICRLDMSQSEGWMDQTFWDWIKERDAIAG